MNLHFLLYHLFVLCIFYRSDDGLECFEKKMETRGICLGSVVVTRGCSMVFYEPFLYEL
jgi:hypothetical protein